MSGPWSPGFSFGFGPLSPPTFRGITATDVLPLPINCVLAGDQPDIEPSVAFADIVAKKFTTKVVLSGSAPKRLAGSNSFTTTTGSLRR